MIRVEREQAVAVVVMDRPKVNALSPAFLEALDQGLAEAWDAPGTRAVVLASAQERAFSAGFDLKELDRLEPAEFAGFFGAFARLYRRVAWGPAPVVAAVAGHALAGGAILALACERRVFGTGDWGFGLTEVDLGLPLPGGVIELLREGCDAATAYEIAVLGRVLRPAEAFDRGLAHRLVPAGEVVEAALEEARDLARKPPRAAAELRAALRRPLAQRMERADRDAGERFLRWWTGDEAKARRRAVLERLGRGAKG
ncbi:enoyl-CoA hydratase/isomerase family protein [Deferrisoma camini]|uniref:enoyl-CoA hydratase/isomerase family protein n=1 Tax=Deferrisoma camini TaxID=1035120 RepID=UPI00046D8874|nr:enoyl-CoA hydratase/isomerase family protein [Deferrisoma camini]